jgi:DNA helicase II / ATP-dependent DNA helicase PcrA
MNQNIILGPPGTGKTTTLLNLVEEYLDKGITPDKIGFVTFTKKATNEAKDRAAKKFNLDYESLPYFRTLHSLAFRQSCMSKSSVMDERSYADLSAVLGTPITGGIEIDIGQITQGDKCLEMDNSARIRMISLREVWEERDDPDISWHEVEYISKSYRLFKQMNMLHDFTDMIQLFLDDGFAPDLEVLFVDEAQDLSKLQWRMVSKLAEHSRITYIAGDDDQAIYKWAGADVDSLIGMSGRVVVLDKSYRLPVSVWNKANDIVSRISRRRPKTFRPSEREGTVQYINSVDDTDLGTGNWLALVRNNYQMQPIIEHCRSNGYYYESELDSPKRSDYMLAALTYERLRSGHTVFSGDARSMLRMAGVVSKDFCKTYVDKDDISFDFDRIWHEALVKIPDVEREYLIAARRRGEKFSESPRIRISTIHGAKGGEADNVLLFTDIGRRAYESMAIDSDSETRVFYVGVTRAKHSLYIVEPATKYFFDL